MPVLNMDPFDRFRRDVADSTAPAEKSAGDQDTGTVATDIAGSTAKPSALDNLQNKIMAEINSCKFSLVDVKMGYIIYGSNNTTGFQHDFYSERADHALFGFLFFVPYTLVYVNAVVSNI